MKIPVDKQFLKYSDQPIWHQKPCHVQSQLNHISSLFWCSVCTSADHLDQQIILILTFEFSLWPFKKYVLYIVVWICVEWITFRRTTSAMLLLSHDQPKTQLRHFTAIHKSSPVSSWDSKVSIECALQNLGGRIFAYCFSNTMYSDVLLFWRTVFCILYGREVLNFGCSANASSCCHVIGWLDICVNEQLNRCT